MTPELTDAAINAWTWKTPAMRDMTLAVCRLALERSNFSANDLPIHGEGEHGGSGIAGTVFGQLVKAEILEPVGAFGIDGAFYPRTIHNSKGNRIGVWRLRNSHLARALIKRHAPLTEPPAGEQMCLFGVS